MRGKKLIILLVVLLTGFSEIRSQPGSGAEFGIKGGLNLAGLGVDSRGERNLTHGFHAGMFYVFPLSGRFELQPEIMYSTRGGRIIYDSVFLSTGPVNMIEAESIFNMAYVDILVSLGFRIYEQLSVNVGPYMGFLINANVEAGSEVLGFLNIDDAGMIRNNEFRRRDYGISAGMGMDFHRYKFGLRYNVGLSRMAVENTTAGVLLGNAGNRLLQIYFAIRF